jgi:hypothetical protein
VENVERFLRRARLLVVRRRALTWGIRGLAAGAVAALAFELVQRRYPVEPAWPALAGCAVLAIVVAAGGWAHAWPSRSDLARLADLRLGSRERLSTAVEFAMVAGPLPLRQRLDAEAWVLTADPRGVADPGRPIRAALVALICGLAAAALAIAPNPALNALHRQHALAAAQAQAADQVGSLVRQAQAAQAKNPDQQHQALVQELNKAQESVRKAPDAQSAVAALSQAQQDIKSLQDPNLGAKQQAESAAGQQLKGGPADKAGQDMAAGKSMQAASDLRSVADSVGSMTPQQKQQLSQQLQQAAQQSAQGNPQLSQSLQQASQALRNGDDQGASQALRQAADQEQQLSQAQQLSGDAAQAVNGLQQAKTQLAEQSDQAGSQTGQGQPGGQQGQATNQGGQQGGQQPGQAGQQAGQSGQQGVQGNQGSQPGNNAGSGSGQTGSGNGTGSGSSGGSSTTGHAGERIYVPGQSTGSGEPQPNDPNSGTNNGTDNGLVPYESVLSDYASQAQGEVDREVIPEDQRELVQSYFQDLRN